MNRYNVKVNDQIYQVEVADVEANTTNNEESSASICFEAIKAEYDYCVTRAEKLENKVYILLAAFAFLFFDELDVVSLLMRYAVLEVTEPDALPPLLSISSWSSLRLAKCSTDPVITKVSPSKVPSFLMGIQPW